MARPGGAPENMVPGAGGGRQPGAGRPPDAWKAACKAAASKQEVFDIATEILNDKSHPLWLSAWKFLAEQGYGKPEATSNVNVNGQQVIKVYAGIDPAKDV